MIEDNVYLGLSDEELKNKISEKRLNKGMSPWLYWTSELYSVGRLYREEAYYPKLLPLFIYSDHGIHRSSELAVHELENKSNVHFTFNPEREKSLLLTVRKFFWYCIPGSNIGKRKTISLYLMQKVPLFSSVIQPLIVSI